jgi:hypothetical protein
MSREREKIDLSDKWFWRDLIFEEDIYDDKDNVLYECINVDLNNYDSDHGGSVNRTTIFRKVLDNKYFEMNSTHSYDYFEFDDKDALEVFPVERTITITEYE